MKRLKTAKIVNDTGGYVYFEDNIVRPNGVMIIKREEGSRRYTVCVIYGDEQPDGSLRNLQLGEHLVTFIDDAVLVPGTKWYLTLGGLLDGKATHSSPAGQISPNSSNRGAFAFKWRDRLLSFIKH